MQKIERLVALGNVKLLFRKLKLENNVYFVVSRSNMRMKLECRLLMGIFQLLLHMGKQSSSHSISKILCC